MKKFLIPFFALFLLIFISSVLALSGSLSPSRIEYSGDVGRVFQKTLTIKNTNNINVDATVYTTSSNIVLSDTSFRINANTNYSLPFNLTIVKTGYDEGRINVKLRGSNEILDISTLIVLNGYGGGTNPNGGNNITNITNNTINSNATLGNGEVIISANPNPATPTAIAGKDFIINANLLSLINNKTNYTISIKDYEDFSELLILNPQVLYLNYNENKNLIIHLYLKNNSAGNKQFNIRVDYGDSYEELPVYLNIADSSSENITDIAYVVRTSADDNFLNVIHELGYNYTLITSSQVTNTDFSKFKMILLGDERIANVPVNNYKSLFANPDYYTGWSSSKASTTRLNTYISNQNISITNNLTRTFNAYTNTQTTLYYLTRTKYGCKSVATTGNSTVDLGHFSVAIKKNPRRVFFGITKSNYWSAESRQLFKNSIDWIIKGEDRDNDGYFGDSDCNDNDESLYRNIKAYGDTDRDGFGSGNYTDVCIGTNLISGYSYIDGDCNDNNANVNPNSIEIPYNGIDDDCDGYDLADVDNDGYCKSGYFVQNAFEQCPNDMIGIGSDCNDNDPNYNIGSSDIFKNCRNDAPFIDNILKITVNEGETIVINVLAGDPENNTLVYAINDTRFSKNNNIFSWLTGYNDAGNYVFRVNVTDGNLSNATNVYVEVKNTNRLPSCNNIPTIIWDENSNITRDLNDYCSDPDDDNVEFSLYQVGNENIISSVNNDGVIHLTSREYWNGNSWIKFRLSDGINSSITNQYNIIVNPVNQVPMIVENLDTIVLHEDTPSINLIDLNDYIFDVDSNLTYGISGNNNVDIVINDSIVSFYPKNAFVGNESVEIRANDGEFNVSFQTILEVLYVRKAPKFGEINCTTSLIEDTPYTCELSAIDAENDSFNFSAARNNNLNCSVIGSTLNYIGFKDHNGSASCILKVRDNDGYNDIAFNVSIENVNDPPYFYDYSPENNTKVYNNSLKEFRVDARDVDSSNLSIIWMMNNETVGNGTTYNFRKTIGWYNLLVVISDGGFNVSNIWNIYVGDYNDFKCSEVSGYLCTDNQICNGKLLGVYDSPDNCCSIQCSDKPPVFLNIKRDTNSSSLAKLDIRNPINMTEFFTDSQISVDLKITNDATEDIKFDVYAYLYDNTRENVVEKSTDSFKLSKSDTKTDILQIDIPKKIKETDDYYIFVKLVGDGKKTNYYNEKYVKIKIKRAENDLVVDNIEINPREALCGDSIQISAMIKNYGTKVQDATVRIESPLIGTSRENSVAIQEYGDSNNEDIYEGFFVFKINDNAKAGEYKIRGTVIYNGETNTNEETIVLGECKKLGEDTKPLVNQNVTSVKLASKISEMNYRMPKQIIVLILFTMMLATFLLVVIMMKIYGTNEVSRKVNGTIKNKIKNENIKTGKGKFNVRIVKVKSQRGNKKFFNHP